MKKNKIDEEYINKRLNLIYEKLDQNERKEIEGVYDSYLNGGDGKIFAERVQEITKRYIETSRSYFQDVLYDVLNFTKGYEELIEAQCSINPEFKLLVEYLRVDIYCDQIYNYVVNNKKSIPKKRKIRSEEEYSELQDIVEEMNIPYEYKCPISQSLMKMPVIVNGISYDLDNIVKWLKENKTSPCTNQRINFKFIMVNENLKSLIDRTWECAERKYKKQKNKM